MCPTADASTYNSYTGRTTLLPIQFGDGTPKKHKIVLPPHDELPQLARHEDGRAIQHQSNRGRDGSQFSVC